MFRCSRIRPPGSTRSSIDCRPPSAVATACCEGMLAQSRMLARIVSPSMYEVACAFGPQTAIHPER